MRGRSHRTLKRRAVFLAALAETASVTRACEAAKFPRQCAYDWRRDDADFAAAWDEAVERGTDALEDEAVRRAKDGVAKPVYYHGNRVDTVRDPSDPLLMFLLKARRPEVYRDQVQITGKLSLEALVNQSLQSLEPPTLEGEQVEHSDSE